MHAHTCTTTQTTIHNRTIKRTELVPPAVNTPIRASGAHRADAMRFPPITTTTTTTLPTTDPEPRTVVGAMRAHRRAAASNVDAGIAATKAATDVALC